MDGQEIKLGLFADHLTGFLKNDRSLIKFFELVLPFGKCSGLVMNHHKSELLLLGNSFPAHPKLNHTPFKDLTIKNSVKILGVYFTYDCRLRRKLKVARYSFSGSIPAKFEHKLRRHKPIFGKIATTVVLDEDENLFLSGLQRHRSCHSNEMTLLPILLAAVYLGTRNCSSKIIHGSFFLQ